MIAPVQRAPGPAGAEALFAEARRRRRRRRVTAAAATLAAAGLVAAGLVAAGLAAGEGARAPAGRAGPRPRPALTGRPETGRFTLPPAQVGWVDYQGRLHAGNVATGAQHVLAAFPSAAGGWFAAAAGHLFWLDFSVAHRAPIRDYDLATGRIRYLARGQSVFAAADGRHVYVMRSGTALTEFRADGSGRPRPLAVPAGWHLDFPRPVAVAGGGITVIGNADRADAFPAGIAIWYPATGQLRRLSNGGRVIAGYTPRDGRRSLLAWAPSRCPRAGCAIKITNTATMVTSTVRSPLHHGFTGGNGAFSPDGAQLAVFARRAGLGSSRPNRSELAIISTRTGRLRIVRAARLETQEDAGWVLWLPGGRRLLAGALHYSYAVDAKTLAARPFFFFPGPDDHDIMDTPDINFSAFVIPRGAP